MDRSWRQIDCHDVGRGGRRRREGEEGGRGGRERREREVLASCLPPCKSFSLTNAPTLTCLNPGVRDREKDSPGQTGIIHHPPRAMAALFLLVRRAASPRSTFAQLSRGHACASTMCLTLQCSRNLLRRRRLSHPRGPRYQHVGLRPCSRHVFRVFGNLHVPPPHRTQELFPCFYFCIHEGSDSVALGAGGPSLGPSLSDRRRTRPILQGVSRSLDAGRNVVGACILKGGIAMPGRIE